MGFWKKLFSGSNQPDKDESVGVDPTTDEKMKSKDADEMSFRHGGKFSGRPEETKAQRRADPETQKLIREAEVYPNSDNATQTQTSTDTPRPAVDSSAMGKSDKTPEEKRATQPKPASEQKTTPKEAEPGNGPPQAGQHHRKGD